MTTTIREIQIDIDPDNDEAMSYTIYLTRDDTIRIHCINSDEEFEIEPAVLKEIVRVLPELDREIEQESEVPF